jgi:hypothetical protein
VFFRVLLVGFGLFRPGTARAPLSIRKVYINIINFYYKLINIDKFRSL